MRVVLGTKAKVPEWFPKESIKSDRNIILEKLSDKSVVCFSSLGELDTASMTDVEKEIFTKWVEAGAKIVIDSRDSICEMFIGDEFGEQSYISDLLDSKEFRDAWNFRTMQPALKEEPRAILSRMFSPLMTVSSSIKLVDRYFFSALCKGHSSGTVFLEEAIRCNSKIQIFTSSESDSPNLSRFTKTVSSLRVLHKSLQSSARIEIVLLKIPDSGKFMHDRIGYFQLSLGRVAFQLGQGVDSFRPTINRPGEPRSLGELTGFNCDELTRYLQERFDQMEIDGVIC